jgi:hypothetical protein
MLKSERYNLLEDAQSHPLTLCGKPLIGDSSGAVFWPAEKTLLVADLHLRKVPPMPPAAPCCRPTTRARR